VIDISDGCNFSLFKFFLMNKERIAIATISLVRNGEEEALLRQSLEALAALGIPVFLTDGGSPANFVSFLKSFPHFHVFAAKGLWPQASNSLCEAASHGAEWILYTEPDKLAFFTTHLRQMIAETMPEPATGVVMAARSAEGYATFPPFQQMTEKTINACCREVTGLETDYCYGPFLFHTKLLPLLHHLPENCGWGWRPFLFVIAHRTGMHVWAFTGDFSCPPGQREDDTTERIYRMKQLTQNIEGLVLATTVSLPDN
jgi:hypothetical protein